MKLLNREPTEEMLETAAGPLESFKLRARAIWYAAFDAAPELTVDMEPVWYHHIDNGGQDTFMNMRFCEDETALYSAEQLATLQAENERLRKENEEMKADRDHWKELGHVEYWQQVKKLTAENAELKEIINGEPQH